MTQRGRLDPDDEERLLRVKALDELAAKARQDYREVVVEMIDKSSYREVERLTGISTNTLQRWKREAGK